SPDGRLDPLRNRVHLELVTRNGPRIARRPPRGDGGRVALSQARLARFRPLARDRLAHPAASVQGHAARRSGSLDSLAESVLEPARGIVGTLVGVFWSTRKPPKSR